MASPQTIPARHGVATFVPAGQTIKIINTSGGQVVDTWAFALPQPAPKKHVEPPAAEHVPGPTGDLPSQEEAEHATKGAGVPAQPDGGGKSGAWSRYVPSLATVGRGGKKSPDGAETGHTKHARSWGQYFKPGTGVSSYVPEAATHTVSRFVRIHNRDPSKTYLEQLQDFSKTPVGAAGMSVITGSGYGGGLYAGYRAWNARNAGDAPDTEFLSMCHSRAATLHVAPRVGDRLVTNLRAPILTVQEDASPGVHDGLLAACDPPRYRQLGVEAWAEHGSCAENLVRALKELNERAGLTGAHAVGADVTVNRVPAPLALFAHVRWSGCREACFAETPARAGDYVRFKAERDVVVVMSACPQPAPAVNPHPRQPTDAAFVVEEAPAAAAASAATTKRAAAPTTKKPGPSGASQQPPAGGAPNPATPPVEKEKAREKKNPTPSASPPPHANAQRPVKATPPAVLKPPVDGAPPPPPPPPPPAGRKKPRKLTRPPSDA